MLNVAVLQPFKGWMFESVLVTLMLPILKSATICNSDFPVINTREFI